MILLREIIAAGTVKPATQVEIRMPEWCSASASLKNTMRLAPHNSVANIWRKLSLTRPRVQKHLDIEQQDWTPSSWISLVTIVRFSRLT